MQTTTYNKINCIFNFISTFSTLLSFASFLTFLLLLTTNYQFIAFNEFSTTGKYPAVFFYVAIVSVILYFALTIASIFGIVSTHDILNKWNDHKMRSIYVFIVSLVIAGLLQLAGGILTLVYTKAMPVPLREYMAENLRSNYTGGLGAGFLERQYDRSVDWVQINYQCCGVISYEDYRNGYFYNTYNKYTIVSVVPNSCCIYRDQTSSLVQCKMKSVNIFRKGCYDILMFWMDSYGAILTSILIVGGVLDLIFSLIFSNITRQIKNLKQRQFIERNLIKHKINNYQFGQNISNRQFDTNTLDETMSYVETKT